MSSLTAPGLHVQAGVRLGVGSLEPSFKPREKLPGWLPCLAEAKGPQHPVPPGREASARASPNLTARAARPPARPGTAARLYIT